MRRAREFFEEFEKAYVYSRRALECAELAANPFEKGRALVQLGRVALLKGRYYESEKALRQALEIGEKYEAKEALEIFLIRKALEQSGNNLTRAGELLGTTRGHVHKKKKQYGL
ncbi:MAG: hypothetical protein N0A16_05875 [Blastocatellia bacterium]|nr:hypothetical protein [Blastocatellia bacterium]MCS7157238.1 hypothetical protein [Blastocatellia bacterium]MCX7752073.1 hypothetical protein [Blastocatellia bacterium]MDW8167179.1 helix-turn-helix domain-containing protein [Acidobacteriota bacterium]MDW8256504.1 helix-turn-helix domain-containing protein [Acidobacteriota bacterium]